jgi:hypothetical protein
VTLTLSEVEPATSTLKGYLREPADCGPENTDFFRMGAAGGGNRNWLKRNCSK